ncbi:MAG: pirin family protein [Gammaproteobacteria bacterium]
MTTIELDTSRSVASIIDSVKTLEGGGFPVRRPFPTDTLMQVDPFLLLDHLGPVTWGPGEGIGAPEHPHRGFETVTYLLSGEMEHKDSAGHAGKLGPGDVQWMTAGAGIVHSELPSPTFMRDGGVMHGFQIWVNLPARDKMMAPRYQEIPSARIPTATSKDGRVRVKVIAGNALGVGAVIETRTPIQYLHYTLQPGGETTQAIPEQHNAMVYIVRGAARVGADNREIHEGQLAVLGPGNAVRLANDIGAAESVDLLVLSGVPIREPVARYGPFVMNSQDQIRKAIRDYQEGRLGRI